MDNLFSCHALIILQLHPVFLGFYYHALAAIFAAIKVSQYCNRLKISPPVNTIPTSIGTVNVNDKTGPSKRLPTIPPTSAHVPVKQHIIPITTAENKAVFLIFRLHSFSPAFI